MNSKMILCLLFLTSSTVFAGMPDQSFIFGKVEGFDQQTVSLTTRHGKHIKIPRSAVKSQELEPGKIIQVNVRTSPRRP